MPKTNDGKQYVCLWPTEGTKKNFISHNWCDKTTWTTTAVRVVDEVATHVSGNLVYSVASGSIIDTYHGKITNEDYLLSPGGNSYRVVVKVNDVSKAEQDPHYGSGGDYTVNYHSGTVTFLSALQPEDVVKVTYHYASGSDFILKPDAGKVLKVKRIEVQFSKNIVLKDSVKFQLYIGANPVGNPFVYKTMNDYINESNGSHPVIPAMGVSGSNPTTDWRNMSYDSVIYSWDYQAMTELKSSLSASIKIFLDHHTPFGGDTATATFYCFSENE